jgi:thiamine-phosphate pyrophosphorylase
VILPRLNAIVDVEIAEREAWAPLDLATAYLAGGARFLQLRAKRLAGGALLDLASRVAERAHSAGAIWILNDRADLARLAGAAGVHVGQEDLSPVAVRALLGPQAIVGLSTHTEAQIDAALTEPISYLAVGPVFGTSTKATGYASVGLGLVGYGALKAHSRELPLVAIGGITLDRAGEVIRAGATSLAVITDLLNGGDPERRVCAYIKRLGELSD